MDLANNRGLNLLLNFLLIVLVLVLAFILVKLMWISVQLFCGLCNDNVDSPDKTTEAEIPNNVFPPQMFQKAILRAVHNYLPVTEWRKHLQPCWVTEETRECISSNCGFSVVQLIVIQRSSNYLQYSRNIISAKRGQQKSKFQNGIPV